MYAFAQRGDAHVVDEPLYAHFLRETGESRPYRDDVLRAQDNDGNSVVRDVVLGDPGGASGKEVRFFKHMAKQLVGDGFDKSFLAKTKNVILVRHPRDILLSYHTALGEASAFNDSQAFFFDAPMDVDPGGAELGYRLETGRVHLGGGPRAARQAQSAQGAGTPEHVRRRSPSPVG